MPRVKGGVRAHKQREKVLKYAKGFKWGRKAKKKLAQEALVHAWSHAFHGRKEKKRNMRALWNVKIGAALGKNMSYSKFISTLKKKNIKLDRKILADLAEYEPKVFEAILGKVK
jgi:large subunit ribosomal protein L20